MYYYAKERRGDKVVSIYVGRGDLAVVSSVLLEEAKEEREYDREKRDEEAKRQLEHLEALRVGRQALELAGYHRTRGEWRRTRKARKAA